LKAELQSWLQDRPAEPDTPIFPEPRSGPISHEGYGRDILARARKASKIADLNFRMCRTTFATQYNGDLKDAQEILGHHSAAFTLERYRKPLPERAAAASEDLDARLSAKVVPIRKGASPLVFLLVSSMPPFGPRGGKPTRKERTKADFKSFRPYPASGAAGATRPAPPQGPIIPEIRSKIRIVRSCSQIGTQAIDSYDADM
jgi:hypothetical protein